MRFRAHHLDVECFGPVVFSLSRLSVCRQTKIKNSDLQKVNLTGAEKTRVENELGYSTERLGIDGDPVALASGIGQDNQLPSKKMNKFRISKSGLAFGECVCVWFESMTNNLKETRTMSSHPKQSSFKHESFHRLTALK